jgi:hypothetical protein
MAFRVKPGNKLAPSSQLVRNDLAHFTRPVISHIIPWNDALKLRMLLADRKMFDALALRNS